MTANSAISPSLLAMHTQTTVQTELVQMQKQQLTFEIFEKIGETKGLLRAEKLQLESENRILHNDIIQLTTVQIAELNSAVDSNHARREMIVQRLKTIVHKFKKISEKKCGGIPLNTQPFKALIASINEYNDEKLRKYPDYCRDQEEAPSIQAVVLFQPLFDLCKTDPFLLSLTQASIDNCESLRNELIPLKAANFALIDKKEIMLKKHDLHVKDLHEKEKIRLRAILKTIRSIQTGMDWSTPIVSFDHCTNCIWLGDREEETLGRRAGLIHHARQQEVVKIKIEKAKCLLENFIVTIEGFTDPKEDK